MKQIIKNNSPIEFEEWKRYKKPNNWNDLDGNPVSMSRRNSTEKYYSKYELRHELLKEQSNLCCYCESIIENNPLKVKIEHLEPKIGNENQHLIFDYNNLLLSCNGGERDPKPKILHCDASKGSKLIPITPLDRRCMTEIDYTLEGKVIGITDDAKKTINILNIHISKLVNKRFAIISGLIFTDRDNTELISPEEAFKLHSKIKLKLDFEYYSAVLKCLSIIMNAPN